MTQQNQTLRHEDLAQFTGSTTWYQHPLNRKVIYTEGVQFLAERGGAYWLVDAIASYIDRPQFRRAAAHDPRIAQMHFWNLTVSPDCSATITAIADNGEPPFIEQEIGFMYFPLSQIDIWAQHNGEGYTLMLPSEY